MYCFVMSRRVESTLQYAGCTKSGCMIYTVHVNNHQLDDGEEERNLDGLEKA